MFRPIDFFVLLRRHRGKILAAGVAGALLMGATGFLFPRQWEARSAFTSFQSGGVQLGSLSALTQQFGVQLPQGGDGATPLFYSSLIQTRGLVRALLAQPSPFADTSARDLGDILGVSRQLSGTLRREATVDKVLQAVTVDLNRENGVVSVGVKTHDPQVSLWINRSLLQLLDTYFGAIRRTRARSERLFANEQRMIAKREARAAEEALEVFLRSNKNYSNSPTLTAEFERLSRETSLRQSVYSTLEQAFYKARLDEVRDTPTISVIEQPVEPAKPVSRYIALRLLFGLFLGAVFTALILVMQIVLEPAIGQPAKVVSFRTVDDLCAADAPVNGSGSSS